MGNGYTVSPLTPELNPSAQRCLTRFFTRDFGKTAGLQVLVHTCVRFVVLTPMFMIDASVLEYHSVSASEYLETVPGS
jgi:hypothetical protein